jgi:YVTN family beta-propeller protein
VYVGHGVIEGQGGYSVIDAPSNTVLGHYLTGPATGPLAVNPNGRELYAVHSYVPGWVSVIDTAKNTVTATVPMKAAPFGIAVHPEGTFVYVANSFHVGEARPCYSAELFCDVEVIAFNPRELPSRYRIVVGDDLTGVAVDPAGTRLYVANIIPPLNYGESVPGVISIIDLTLPFPVVTDRIVLGSPERYHAGPYAVAVHPSGTRVYVTDFGDDLVSVIDPVENRVVAEVPIGEPQVGLPVTPASLAVTPDGTRVYVVNLQTHNVSVIDTATNRVVATIAVGRYPLAFGQFIGPPGVVITPPPTPTETPTPSVTATVPPLCIGDCNLDRAVTVDELVMGVNIARDRADLTGCPAIDANHDTTVSVNELVAAVAGALEGCPELRRPTCSPTASRTNSPLVSPTATRTATPHEVPVDSCCARRDGGCFDVPRGGNPRLCVPGDSLGHFSTCDEASGQCVPLPSPTRTRTPGCENSSAAA